MQVLAVVVRYKMPLAASPTMQSLTDVFLRRPDLARQMPVLLWDNSPEPLASVDSQITVTYRHATSNVGVSGAYNEALTLARESGIPWLLLLDQDTELSEAYLDSMLRYSRDLAGDSSIATVIPFVYSGNIQVSPRRIGKVLRHTPIPRSTSGKYPVEAYAVNSGTLMRAESLFEIGGYSNRYWLDLSDAYIFHVLHLRGKSMYIAGDLQLQHSIASLNFNEDMSPARYANFLAAENCFADEFRPPWQNALYTFWLLARTARQYRRYRNKAFARLSLKATLDRLMHGRTARQKRYIAELDRRDLPAIQNGQQIG